MSLKAQILTLREQNYSYEKISKELKCSKSTISYYCSSKEKENILKRKQRYKKEAPWKYYLIKRVSDFRRRTCGNGILPYNKDWNKKFRTAVSEFRCRKNAISKSKYTYKDVIAKFGYNPKCALTGRIIDITKDNYNLDHVIPISKGGTNDLDNMSIVIPEANNIKGNLLTEELIELCKEILNNFGYTVSK